MRVFVKHPCSIDQFIADSWLAGISGLEIAAHLERLGVRSDVALEALSLVEVLDSTQDAMCVKLGCGKKER